MGILGAITGISAAIGVGSSLIGAVQGNNIGKAEAKAAKKQAKLQLESTKAEAKYDNGMLLLRLPKKAGTKAKALPVM